MSSATGQIAQPETDNRAVLDALYANYGTVALLVAQEVGPARPALPPAEKATDKEVAAANGPIVNPSTFTYERVE